MNNTLIEYLLFRSKSTPDGAAILNGKGQTSYKDLLIMVRKVASKFRRAGMLPGQLAISSISNKRLDWIVTLALVHEACISCSNHGYSSIDLPFSFDWYISDREVSGASTNLLIDEAWLNEVNNEPYEELNHQLFESLDSVVRLVLTSGTEGVRKAVGISSNQIKGRFNQRVMTLTQFGPEITFLPLSTIGGINNAFHTILSGSPLVCITNFDRLIKRINNRQVGMLSGSPIQLAAFIQHLEDRQISLSGRLPVVASGGGATPEALLNKIYQHLTERFINYYGSTETGGVSYYLMKKYAQEMVVGCAFPDVSAEIVNEVDEEVSVGEIGILRIKTPYMATEYFKNKVATEQAFKGGWFYPGDRARLNKRALIILSGRDSELINRGGIKINPRAPEEFILNSAFIEDAAIFPFSNDMGIQEIGLAVVPNEGFNEVSLKKEILEKFGASRVPNQIIKVKEIPRNVMGKVEKFNLKQLIKK